MNDKTEWVMVPRAPTPEMELAGKHTMKGAADMLFERFIAIAVYQSMLAAAPTPPAQEDQLDAAAAEIARLRSESATQSERLDALKAEKDELQALCDKLAGLLSRTAVALRGPEPPLTRWSWHDLPERAQAAIAAIDLMERVAKNLAQDAPTPPVQEAQAAYHFRAMRRVGWWVVFDQTNDMGEIPGGFFVEDARAKTFPQEPGWLPNHLVPCWVVQDTKEKP